MQYKKQAKFPMQIKENRHLQTEQSVLKILFFVQLCCFSDASTSERPASFFCGDSAGTEKGLLHLLQSSRVDRRVHIWAHLLEDCYLPAKLQNGDMIAQDAMYYKHV